MRPPLSFVAALGLAAAPALCAPAGPTEPSGGGPRPSNALNPAISVNALLVASFRASDSWAPPDRPDAGAGPESGLSLAEAELVFTASVDPYFKADVIASLADRGRGEDGFEADVEEAFVTALRMPRRLGLRAGKMLLPFGRHNLLHTHSFPFLQPPLVTAAAFGEDGLNEAGVELGWLLPTPWFGQLVAALSDGRNELFAGSRPRDLAWLVHLRNVWDLGESSTLELGGSGLGGRRGEDGRGSARVWGANLTFKHRPVRRAIYHGVELQGEFLRRVTSEPGAAGRSVLAGGYLHARWQASRRWWLQGRWDRLDPGDGPDRQRWSALAAFAPSEFSALRLELSTLRPAGGRRDHQVLVQLNWSIGPHPAHAY